MERNWRCCCGSKLGGKSRNLLGLFHTLFITTWACTKKKSCGKALYPILWLESQKWLSFSVWPDTHTRSEDVSFSEYSRQTAERHSGRIYWIRKIYSHIDFFRPGFMLTIGLNYEKYTMKRTLSSNFIVCCIIHILLCCVTVCVCVWGVDRIFSPFRSAFLV